RDDAGILRRAFLLNSSSAGPFAWFGGKSGQVGNEAAIVVQNQCRSQARHLVYSPGPRALSNAGTLFHSLSIVICLHIPMTYLVLARKWRPRSFDTLVGQDHVVRALTH